MAARQIIFNDEVVEVTYCYIPPYRGARDSLGVPMEPDEPGAIEIERVEYNGIDVTNLLGERGIEEIEALLKEDEQ
jgi:hypothetical protein